jgi:hypothetical protein
VITIEVTETKTVGEGTPVQSQRTVTLRAELDGDVNSEAGEEPYVHLTLATLREAAYSDLAVWEIDRRNETYRNLRRNSIMMILQATTEGQDTQPWFDLVMRHADAIDESEKAMIEREFKLAKELGAMKSGDNKQEQEQEQSWPGQRDMSRRFKRGT